MQFEPAKLRRIRRLSPAICPKWKRQGPEDVHVILESRPSSTKSMPERPLNQSNALEPEVAAVQSDNTYQVSKNAPSVLSTNESDVKTAINHQDTIVLFWKRKYNFCLGVGSHHSYLHLVVSMFDTGADPNLVDRSFFNPSCRK